MKAVSPLFRLMLLWNKRLSCTLRIIADKIENNNLHLVPTTTDIEIESVFEKIYQLEINTRKVRKNESRINNKDRTT